MKVKVVGLKDVNFVDSSSGKNITGTTIFVLKEEKHTVGLESGKYFIKSSINIDGLKVNDNVDLLFNERGKVESLTICK